MNRSETVQAIAVCDAVAKKLRADLNADAEAEYVEQGTIPTWRLPGAVVSGSTSSPSVAIVDEAAFLAWVAERYPTEVETLQRIRPAFQQAFLKGVVNRGDPACDAQGEPVPGLQWRAGGGFGGIRVVLDGDMKQALAAYADQVAETGLPLALTAAGVTVR